MGTDGNGILPLERQCDERFRGNETLRLQQDTWEAAPQLILRGRPRWAQPLPPLPTAAGRLPDKRCPIQIQLARLTPHSFGRASPALWTSMPGHRSILETGASNP